MENSSSSVTSLLAMVPPRRPGGLWIGTDRLDLRGAFETLKTRVFQDNPAHTVTAPFTPPRHVLQFLNGAAQIRGQTAGADLLAWATGSSRSLSFATM
jgi:hypothetical protein